MPEVPDQSAAEVAWGAQSQVPDEPKVLVDDALPELPERAPDALDPGADALPERPPTTPEQVARQAQLEQQAADEAAIAHNLAQQERAAQAQGATLPGGLTATQIMDSRMAGDGVAAAGPSPADLAVQGDTLAQLSQRMVPSDHEDGGMVAESALAAEPQAAPAPEIGQLMGRLDNFLIRMNGIDNHLMQLSGQTQTQPALDPIDQPNFGAPELAAKASDPEEQARWAARAKREEHLEELRNETLEYLLAKINGCENWNDAAAWADAFKAVRGY